MVGDPGFNPVGTFPEGLAANTVFEFELPFVSLNAGNLDGGEVPFPGGFFDPPFVDAFAFSILSGPLFAQVQMPVLGDADGYQLLLDSMPPTTVGEGNSFFFFPAVDFFVIGDIEPPLDADDDDFETAFPVGLGFEPPAIGRDVQTVNFQMIALVPSQLQQQAPEPTTLALLGLGLIALGIFRLRLG